MTTLDARRPARHGLDCFWLSAISGLDLPTNGSLERLGGLARALQQRAAGILEVMGAGSIAPNPGEFIAPTALEATLEQVMTRAELLLVDGPPMLLAGDALTLSAKVEGIIVVARLNSFDRDAIDELGRFLKACASEKLGLVVTDDEWNRGYGYYAHAEPRVRKPDRRTSGRSHQWPCTEWPSDSWPEPIPRCEGGSC